MLADKNSKNLINLCNRFGVNKKRIPKIKGLLELILEQFEDRILQILCVAAVVALALGLAQHGFPHGIVEGLSIMIAVTIIVSVTAGQNLMKEKQFQKLVMKAAEDEVAVFRGHDGVTQTIPGEEIVVGDIIKVEGGMKVPADCILIRGTDISCDEAAMTGEPDNMDKDWITEANVNTNPDPFMLAKTLIISGQGIAMVCAVGANTQSGQAEEKLTIEEEATPLQLKLETIANEIGKIGVYVSILTFIANTVNLVIRTMSEQDSQLVSMDTVNELVNFLIISVSLIIAAVPEGLPLAVTISLAFSVMQMKKENNLVRQLSASETMGGAHEICTDKTGTLTLNKMTVKQVYVNNDIVDAEPNSLETIGKETADILIETVLFNCSARIEINNDPEINAKYVTKGNCTERGLLHYFMDCNTPVFDLIKNKDGNVLVVIPFNSGRKRATTGVQHPTIEDTVRVFCKGAPEIVIKHCSKILNNGSQDDLGEDKIDEILNDVVKDTFAPKAYRTLLVAYKDMSMDEFNELKEANNEFKKEKDREILETDLCVAGIFAL